MGENTDFMRMHVGANLCVQIHVCACEWQKATSSILPQEASILFREKGSLIDVKLTK